MICINYHFVNMSRSLALLLVFAFAVHCERPPKSPPEALITKYSLDGAIPVEHYYVDDTMGGNGTHFSYSTRSIEAFIGGANKIFNKIRTGLDRVINKDDFILSMRKDEWIHFALHKYQHLLTNATVNVIGSMEPWVEASAIALGCEKVVTVEYNKLTYNHSKIETVDGSQFDSFYHPSSSYYNSIDVSISLSSFDHDGLGRYGDPLNPTADLEAMKRTYDMLRPGGVLFLTVPVGPDVVVFNLHRRYGNIRLPLLLSSAPWEEVDRLGWQEEKLTAPANWRQTYEPVIVLRKPAANTEVEAATNILVDEL